MPSVVFAAHKKAFDSVLFSAVALVRKSKEPISFHLLSMPFLDISPAYRPFGKKEAKYIEKVLKSLNPETAFELHDVRSLYSEKLKGEKREAGGKTPYSLLKYLLPDVLDSGETVLFLEPEAFCLEDPSPLFSFDLKGKCFAAGLFRRHKRGNHFKIEPAAVLVDLKAAREKKIADTAFSYLSGRHAFSDVKLFSHCFREDTALLPEGYLLDCPKDEEKGIFGHFRHKGIARFLPGWPAMLEERSYVNQVSRHRLLKEDYEVFSSLIKARDEDEMKKRNERDAKYIIQIRHLYKNYGSLKAVDDVSFNVERGALFAFLGLNGAGKSTTINIISSILEKDYGTIVIDGHDLVKERNLVKKEIGIVFQTSTLDDNLTSYENLSTRAEFYNMPKAEKEARIKKISEMLDLEPLLDRQVKALSGGQRRRLDIARSMVHEPKLLILDEPTTGLDPRTRQDVWRLIDEIRNKTGMTVFLTTHYLEEAEKATDVVIMDKGRIIAQGTPNELKNRYSKDYVIVYQEKNQKMDMLAKKEKGTYDEDLKAYRFPVKDSEKAYEFINLYKDDIHDFEVKKGDMDDVFLRVTGLKFVGAEEEK